VLTLPPFRHVVVADFEFEFGGHAGNLPRPICMVAKDLCTGQEWRLWRGEFGAEPPFPVGDETLFVAYYASAELGCFLELGWQMPKYVLDLYAEFRNLTNLSSDFIRPTVQEVTPTSRGLGGALAYFGLAEIDMLEKNSIRDLALRGPPWSNAERADLFNYCASDTYALERLLPAMLPHITNLNHALLRGRFMQAAARIERAGVPIDIDMLGLLREHWAGMQLDLIAAVDELYGVYEGRTFKEARWAQFLAEHGIPWPRLESGELDLDKETFRQMAKSYPIVSAMRELRHSLSEMRLNDLAVGEDARARTLLSVFASQTSRNQPSSTKYIFGLSVWLRSLIKAPAGYGVAYIDWSQQEFGIAAYLSQDPSMIRAYQSGDPYRSFAEQAGAIPLGIPESEYKATYKKVRDRYKQCALAMMYGMSAEGLAFKLGVPTIVARELIRAHKETFRKFWAWLEAAMDQAYQLRSLETVFGWRVRLGHGVNPRSMQNFPMQANGAEMMRLAAALATERGIEVCATVHDAFLICAPLDRLEDATKAMQAAMVEASRIVLGGNELRSDAHPVRYPDRYCDEDRGREMWDRVVGLIAKRTGKAIAA
jgi:DNA polymerase I